MVSKAKLKAELLEQIDKTSQIQLEKVDRYLSMVEVYQKLQKEAIKNPLITIENGKQRFVKANPALADMNKLNASLIALGKDMGLVSPPNIGEGDDGQASDLV